MEGSLTGHWKWASRTLEAGYVMGCTRWVSLRLCLSPVRLHITKHVLQSLENLNKVKWEFSGVLM